MIGLLSRLSSRSSRVGALNGRGAGRIAPVAGSIPPVAGRKGRAAGLGLRAFGLASVSAGVSPRDARRNISTSRDASSRHSPTARPLSFSGPNDVRRIFFTGCPSESMRSLICRLRCSQSSMCTIDLSLSEEISRSELRESEDFPDCVLAWTPASRVAAKIFRSICAIDSAFSLPSSVTS